MSQNYSTNLLQNKLNEANQFLATWDNIQNKISQIDVAHQTNLIEADTILQAALNEFKTKIEYPLLTIAVTGTTSSGKSSLINLLCGADIMPRMAGEMSAGLVSIYHISPHTPSQVIIHETQDARWQCGTWTDLADKEISECLTRCMDSYNQCRHEQNPPAYPKIDVYYPISYFLNTELNAMGLPTTTRFRLLDLPGLKNSTDELNKEVFKECKEALCLVTYDMAETDPEKRKNLINEVLTQIKSMGGALNRMLFVLNRIDVYDKDREAERRKNEIEQTVLAEIKTVLVKNLPEYKHLVNDICFSRLSSLPALYAMQLIQGKSTFNTANSLEKHFAFLIPESIIDDLPRKKEKWSEHDFHRVGVAVLENCYANTFFTVLSKHIQKNFAKLILPPLLIELNSRIAYTVSEWLHLTTAQILETEEACKHALTDLEKQQESLSSFLQETLAKLESSFKTQQSLEMQCKALLACEPYSQLPSDTLAPLYLWYDDIAKETDSFLSIIWYFITYPEEIVLLSPELQKVVTESISKLNNDEYSIRETYLLIVNSPKYDLEDEYQRKLFNFKKQILTEFITGLSHFLNEHLSKKILPQLFQRVQDSLEKVLDCYVGFVQLQINQTIPQWGLSLSRPTILLEKENNPLRFFTNFSIEIKPRIESVRDVWTLWLWERDVEIGQLPSAKELDQLFVQNLQKERMRLEPIMSQQIAEHFEKNYQSLKTEQERVYENFKVQYQQRQQAIQNEKETVQKPWQELLPIVEQWQQITQVMTDLHQLETEIT